MADEFGVKAPRRAATAGIRLRDPRIDFYRGLAMYAIFVSHVPSNVISQWLPTRFGLSDAAEVFVFCSGIASAIAFAKIFDRAGWGLGTVRVAVRCWQIYWAHIGLFVACAAFLAGLDTFGSFDKVYIGTLNLWRFFLQEPGPLLVGLVTLTYVPNYFDILPMYMVLLAMIPVAMALARIHPALVAAASVTLWLLSQAVLWPWGGISLPAEPWSDRQWFFNPFAWQMLFFTGFAFGRGWLPSPPVRPWLIAGAVLVLLVVLPMSNYGLRTFGFDWAREIRGMSSLTGKSDLSILRFVQFLALAYLAYVVAGPGGRALRDTGGSAIWRGTVSCITLVGQHSLAVFLMSMFWARVTGVGLDLLGRDMPTALALNAIGLILMTATAYLVAWTKSEPWRQDT